MAIFVERPAGKLWDRCRQIQEGMRTGSKVQNKLRSDLRKIVLDDHTDMLLRGVDRYGRPRAPLAESTLKNKKRGPGPSLIPRGMASRFVTNFEALWETGSQGVMFLVCRYRDILSKKGVSFVEYHMRGTKHMPARNTGGCTPKAWSAIKARFARLPEDIRRGGG